MERCESDVARIGERAPRRPFLGIEVDCDAAGQAGEDWVLHGGDLRCFYRGIPWPTGQTLAAGGNQPRGEQVKRTRRTGTYVSTAALEWRHANDQTDEAA